MEKRKKMPLRILRSKHLYTSCKLEFLSSGGAQTPTQVLEQGLDEQLSKGAHSHPANAGKRQSEHPIDQQPVPLHL